jgi:hypothetical protein
VCLLLQDQADQVIFIGLFDPEDDPSKHQEPCTQQHSIGLESSATMPWEPQMSCGDKLME